jgi:methylenetetrahydrofolate dehydrogenase (NADP+)/methenyltetrahydrofolate cyclohydrolase
MPAQIIDGNAIAQEIYADVQSGVAELLRRGKPPHLVAVQVGDNEATDVYVRRQKKRFSDLGIQYTFLHLDAATTTEGLLTHIDFLNSNPMVSGIILTLPLPDGITAHTIQERVVPAKDVEGVNPANLGRLIYNRHAVGPCTALAVLEAIESTGVDIEGKNVCIVGHSDIVGKPVGLCLLRALATITTCHIATRDLARHTREADIVVVAVGKPGLVCGDMISEGTIVIDVGINRVDNGIVGDVSYDAVAAKASWITPVPGGIGPITVAMLARNTLVCARQLLEEDS